jgi:uroporphyrinogen-III decarboxylase
MMTRRERLIATLRGKPVDRPAVNFYEIGGWTPDPDDPDPFNVFQGPGWREMLQFAEEETDIIRMVAPELTPTPDNPRDEFRHVQTWVSRGSRFTRETWHAGGRDLSSLTRRDRDVATTWTIEPLLKDAEDVRAYLELPDEVFAYEVGIQTLKSAECALGDAGIVMVDTHDPLCAAAGLFSMEGYTVVALTEPALFHRLLQKLARPLYARVEVVAREFPGHLWRIVGSEYASEPFLPPSLYEAYEVRYTQPIVDTIQRYGGYARLHSHGRLARILPYIAGMGVDGLDPIEPPPQGDVALIDVRREYGDQMVLFGNLEASEIENLPTDVFERRVHRALEEGTTGAGRGFVLMPSACPYGREINARVMANYRTMVRLAETYGSCTYAP